MSWQECRARLEQVQCQRTYGHQGAHRAEVGEPVKGEDGELIASVLSWL